MRSCVACFNLGNPRNFVLGRKTQVLENCTYFPKRSTYSGTWKFADVFPLPFSIVVLMLSKYCSSYDPGPGPVSCFLTAFSMKGDDCNDN
jgi:hypothetical protein